MFDIMFLQETYTCTEIESIYRNEYCGNISFAHGTNHSKGVMIMMRPGLDCNILKVKVDSNGRYIVQEVNIMGKEFVLINIYAPNRDLDKKSFFKELSVITNEMAISSDK